MNKKNGIKIETVISRIYLFIIAVMVGIILINIMLKNPKEESYGLGTFVKADNGWVDVNGNSFTISNLGKLQSSNGEDIIISYTLPEILDGSEALVFRSKNCYVCAKINNQIIYETDVSEAPFYNHSPGTRWNVINLENKDAKQVLTLSISQAYKDNRAKVDHFYLGDSSAILMGQIQNKVIGIIVSLMILFVGILFLLAWFVLNRQAVKRDYSLLWLSLFAIITAFWCILETNLLQLLTNTLRGVQVADNIMLVAGGASLYLYLNSMYNAFSYRLIRILAIVDISYIVLATLSQLLGLWDYHQTLNGTVVNYGILVVLLIFFVVRNHKRELALEGENPHFVRISQEIGIALLGIGVCGDLIRYLVFDVMDRAFIIRICLLLFIIFFGAGNILQLFQLVEMGRKAKMISELAYKDGLTGVGNRTSYKERLEALTIKTQLNKIQSNEILAYVMFDINNLKIVNDTMGHQRGDELIQKSIRLIKQLFLPEWEIYRIGGDEVVALKVSKKAQVECEQILERFEAKQKEISKNTDLLVSIAYGAAFTRDRSEDGIEQLVKDADFRMYQRKLEMKKALLRE